MKKIICIISQLILLGFTGASIEDSDTEIKNELIYAKGQSKPYTGKVKQYVEEILELSDEIGNKKHEYQKTDRVSKEKTYVDGKLERVSKFYKETGKLYKEENYKNGVIIKRRTKWIPRNRAMKFF